MASESPLTGHRARLRTVLGGVALVGLIASAFVLQQSLSLSTTDRMHVLVAEADAATVEEDVAASAVAVAQPVGLSFAAGEDANSSAAGLTALAAAFTQAGKPYEWGGVGPDTWDCSGLVQWAFAQAGVELPRVSEDQALSGEPIEVSEMAPGDVITFRDAADHVGIYAGGGQVFNAYDDTVPIGLTPLADLPPIHNVQRFQ